MALKTLHLTEYEEHDASKTAWVLGPLFKLNWCSQPENQILRMTIITKSSHVPNPDPQFKDDQPPFKKGLGFFSSLIDAPVHEVISFALQIKVYDYIPQNTLGFFSSLIDAPVHEVISFDLQIEVDDYIPQTTVPSIRY